jgi:tRNA G18 (ribose-2'-O)-methylase SpoU
MPRAGRSALRTAAAKTNGRTPARPAALPKANVGAGNGGLLLYDLRSPINIGMILRLAETFQLQVSIFDPAHVLRDEARLRTISDFACGALQRRPPRMLAGAVQLRQLRRGVRLIATTIEGKASALPEFEWQNTDVLVLGNEYDGLPADLVASAEARLHIPMPDGYVPKPKSLAPIDPTRVAPVANDAKPNLNVAVAAGILCYTRYMATVSAPATTSRRRAPSSRGRAATAV